MLPDSPAEGSPVDRVDSPGEAHNPREALRSPLEEPHTLPEVARSLRRCQEVRLPAGRTAYTDEESRKNFEAVTRVVLPGVPLKSRLLTMPLAHEAGGTEFHPGGKHWDSKDDPEWKALSAWVSLSTMLSASPRTK